MASKYDLEYESIEEAVKDGFKEIGGTGEALRVLKAGWYAIQSRKEQNIKQQRLREAVKNDPRFKSVYEQVKEKLAKKA